MSDKDPKDMTDEEYTEYFDKFMMEQVKKFLTVNNEIVHAAVKVHRATCTNTLLRPICEIAFMTVFHEQFKLMLETEFQKMKRESAHEDHTHVDFNPRWN